MSGIVYLKDLSENEREKSTQLLMKRLNSFREELNKNKNFHEVCEIPDDALIDKHIALDIPVTWYEAVCLCILRSEIEHLTPCYQIENPAICNGEFVFDVKSRDSDGYRLPTADEFKFFADNTTFEIKSLGIIDKNIWCDDVHNEDGKYSIVLIKKEKNWDEEELKLHRGYSFPNEKMGYVMMVRNPDSECKKKLEVTMNNEVLKYTEGLLKNANKEIKSNSRKKKTSVKWGNISELNSLENSKLKTDEE
ncbi:hypothetical protein DYE50_03640 [Treponema ruminis]|uniref:Uncharacterized protein n=1 Tax=Treponema ruminis TaxID=744515 RepID=A0A7W8G7U1_9SPIR|nr:hypothetical protein [Treponema ruminis]MBB5225459.1 hypothetical protein [Treponema ruminis]QSI01672.1 hypothetical protein DYE50_03640 [Treponema ruminis]